MHKLKQLGQQLNMEHIVFASLIQLHVDHVQVAYELLHQGQKRTEQTLPIHGIAPKQYGYHQTIF